MIPTSPEPPYSATSKGGGIVAGILAISDSTSSSSWTDSTSDCTDLGLYRVGDGLLLRVSRPLPFDRGLGLSRVWENAERGEDAVCSLLRGVLGEGLRREGERLVVALTLEDELELEKPTRPPSAPRKPPA